MTDSNFQQVWDLWQRLDMAILAVTDLEKDCSMYRSGLFTDEDLEQLHKDGATCCSNFCFFDSDGNLVDTPITERIVGLPAENLKNVRNIVFVAAGMGKVAPLRSMLRSGIGSILVTDVDVAKAILAKE